MAEVSVERQIIGKIRQMDEVQKRCVLEFVMYTAQQPPAYSARDLLRLPLENTDASSRRPLLTHMATQECEVATGELCG